MSYVLKIWHREYPRTFEQTQEIHSRLDDKPLSDDSIFREFARRLTKRYPCITTLEDDTAAVWTDGPLNGKCDTHVYGIGVLSQHIADVVPFVNETGTSMGLVVYDVQTGVACLPHGWEVTLEHRAFGRHLGFGINESLEPANVERVLRDALEPVLDPAGFKWTPAMRGFVSTYDRGYQLIRFRLIERTAEAILFDFEIHIVDKDVRKIMLAIFETAGVKEDYVATAMSSLALFAFFFGHDAARWAKKGDNMRFELHTPDELRSLAAQLRLLVQKHVISALESVRDPHHLWANLYGSKARQLIDRSAGFRKDGTFVSAVVAKALFNTNRCNGLCTEVLLAAILKTEDLPDVINLAYGRIEFMDEPAMEKKKLDACVHAIEGAKRMAKEGH